MWAAVAIRLKILQAILCRYTPVSTRSLYFAVKIARYVARSLVREMGVIDLLRDGIRLGVSTLNVAEVFDALHGWAL